MICLECQALKKRIAELEDQLADKTTPERIAAIRSAFKLTENESFVLLSLYDAGGKVVSYFWLYNNRPVVQPHNREKIYPSLNDVKVMVHRIRRKIGADVIVSSWGQGYALTPEGIGLLNEVLG